MKYILTDENGGIFGPYNNIEKVDNGYMADGISYQTTVIGNAVKSEVADDYINPDTKVNTKPLLTLEDLQAQIDALKQGA